jgi:hypothetical protein
VERRCVPIWTTRLSFRAESSIALPSATSTLIGFWQYRSHPASIAAIALSACQ